MKKSPATGSIDGLKVRRLEDILPELKKRRQEKSDSERITDLELAVAFLKSKVHTLENKGVDA